MSNFNCEQCKQLILDTRQGYVTECEHYPLEATPTTAPNEMCEFTQGICHDGAAILKDGEPLTIEQILTGLRNGEKALADLKETSLKAMPTTATNGANPAAQCQCHKTINAMTNGIIDAAIKAVREAIDRNSTFSITGLKTKIIAVEALEKLKKEKP